MALQEVHLEVHKDHVDRQPSGHCGGKRGESGDYSTRVKVVSDSTRRECWSGVESSMQAPSENEPAQPAKPDKFECRPRAARRVSSRASPVHGIRDMRKERERERERERESRWCASCELRIASGESHGRVAAVSVGKRAGLGWWVSPFVWVFARPHLIA
jgi:hypothetical protein